jgi:hypothetical protein
LAAFCVAVLGSLSATSKADLVFESTGAVLQANDLSLTLDVLLAEVKSPVVQYPTDLASNVGIRNFALQSLMTGSRLERQSLAPPVFASADVPKGMFGATRGDGNGSAWDFSVHTPDVAQRPFGAPNTAVAVAVPAPSALLLAVLGLGLVGAFGRRLP